MRDAYGTKGASQPFMQFRDLSFKFSSSGPR